MNKMCLAHLGVFLLALHLLSSQVAQATTDPSNATNLTSTSMPNTTAYNMSMGPTDGTSSDKNGSGSIDAFTMLLPLAVAASLLHFWSQ